MARLTDEQKLLMTERRLNDRSLLDLAAGAVLCNLEFYSRKKNGKNPLEKLPISLREKLIRKLEKQFCFSNGDFVEFNKRCGALLPMLTVTVQELDLTSLVSFCPVEYIYEEMPKVIQMIPEKAPGLKSLAINYKIKEMANFEEVEIFGAYKYLLKLEATFMNLSLNQVKVLCRDALPQLQYLHINKLSYELDLEAIQDLKQSLNNLRVLLFEEDQSCFMPSEFTRFCLRHLPNLKVVRHFVDQHIGQNYGIEYDIKTTELPLETSALQHLRIKPNNLGLHLAYPEVTDLMIDWTTWPNSCVYGEQEINAILKFPKVKCLNLNGIASSNIFDRFLTSYGERLETLICTNSSYEVLPCIVVKFSTIFNSCPNLRVLIFDEMIDVIDDSTAQIKFAKLRIFHWNVPSLENTRSVFMSKILAAPDLEEFSCSGNHFDLDDINLISRQIVCGKILRKLTSIKFRVTDKQNVPPRKNRRFKFKKLVTLSSALHELVKNACAFLPNLEHVDVESPFVPNPKKLDIIMKNYSGSHLKNLVDEKDAACYEYIGEKTIVDFLGVFNRRKYVYTHVHRPFKQNIHSSAELQ